MSTITVYGASDDLIEVDGDIHEEFGAYESGITRRVLAVSDGTLLQITYGEHDACWRIAPLRHGTAKYKKTEGTEDGDYTDRVTLAGDDLHWVVVAKPEHVARRGK